MSRSLLASLILHIIVMCLFIFGLPFSYHKVNPDYAIVLDMVDISEITNVKVNNSKKTKQKEIESARNIPKAKQEKKEEKVEPKKEEEKPKKVEDTKAVALPDKKKLQEKPKKEEQKKKEETKKKEEKKKKEENDIFAKSILKTLEEPSEAKEEKKKPDKKEDQEKALEGDTNKEYNSELPLSLSEIDFIRSQIEKHWNTTAFSGADNLGMQVTLYIKLDREGNVLEVKPEKKILTQNPKYGAFIESTIRAVKMASPILNLPADKFKSWEEIKFNFDSSGMIY